MHSLSCALCSQGQIIGQLAAPTAEPYIRTGQLVALLLENLADAGVAG